MAKEVDKRCIAAIHRLNKQKMGKLKFKDFAALKTFGIDKFSRAKLEILLEALPPEAMQAVEAGFPEDDSEKERISALRWMARGLEADRAIRKVKTDCEIRNNAIGARTSY